MKFLIKIMLFLNPRKITEIANKYDSCDNRKRKLTLMLYVLFTIFSSAIEEKGSYLPQIVTELTRNFDIGITKQAVSKQMVNKRSWKIFRAIFCCLENTRHNNGKIDKETLSILKGFKDILIADSSSFKAFKTLLKKYPSVHKDVAGCKLNTLFSLSDFCTIKAKVVAQKIHDNNFDFITLQKNVLYLFDLGYWSYKTFQKINARKSYFVSRLKSGCNPLIQSVNGDITHEFVGKKLSEVKKYFKDNTIDLTVKLFGVDDELRIVGLLYDHTWYLYITNVFDKEMTPQIIHDVYRIRWQIELFFKWIKTYLNGKQLCMRTDNSLLTEIYATLIYCLIVVILVDDARKSDTPIQEYSVPKAINIIKKYSMVLLESIFYRDKSKLRALLSNLSKSLQIKARKDKHPKDNALLSNSKNS